MEYLLMDENQLLSLLPLKKTWLDDIVDVFLKRPRGEAEIDAIAIALMKTCRDIGVEPESTITRTINNFCINSGDVKTKPRFPIFEHIGPAKYRLLTYPNSPELLEIQPIVFSDDAYQETWKFFIRRAEKLPQWEQMSNREKLIVFSRNLLDNNQLKKVFDAHRSVSDLNLDL
jgi:hypothetical protein